MKKMFDEGRFVEAKPIFEKLLKNNPKNSEYNYWYAACCLETNDTVDVEEMLEFAASRNIVKAFWYLGDWYYRQQDYALASENFLPRDFLITYSPHSECRRKILQRLKDAVFAGVVFQTWQKWAR